MVYCRSMNRLGVGSMPPSRAALTGGVCLYLVVMDYAYEVAPRRVAHMKLHAGPRGQLSGIEGDLSSCSPRTFGLGSISDVAS